ncbi:MAG TPA: DHA2 family efflux MFS transporter permease subunit [Gaiella sp.]|nr:DHA2 family efflux MFS transporter permease subunit [Gaiella sp.]
MTITDTRTRWLALLVLCLGDLMIVLDGTIVNVALPSIRDDLGFSQESLAWVVNAYLLTFGGFLLLGGRLGDLFGHRRLFLSGIALFTLASLACGLAGSQEALVAARAVQGLGGAIVSAVALSLIMTLFVEPVERAKAMGVFGFVLSGGGTAGVLLGGVITDVLDWHWIFLVNLPVGIAVFALTLVLLPGTRGNATGRVDFAGAITVTASLMLAVYAIVNGNEVGWTTLRTLGLLGAAAGLMAVFLALESRLSTPLMPLGIFRNRNVSAANVVGVLMAAGMFAYFFLSALYLQEILGYSPMEVGLAYLPSMVIWGASSLLLSDRLVMRLGVKPPLIAGLALMTVGLLLLARTPVEGSFLVDVLPATLAVGLGAGIGFNPILLAAMSGVLPTEAGLASGVVNTAFMMGGALGLAVLASLAAWRTDELEAAGEGTLAALNGGYHAAFLVGALFVVASSAVAGVFLRADAQAAAHEGHGAIGAPASAEAD